MFRSLLFILASVFFWFFGYNAVTSAFSRYAEQELQGNFALVLMICTVAAIVSYMPVGMIAQRIGRKRTILIGIVMLGTAFFAGIFFHSVSPLLYIFFALAGMGWAFINVNSYPMVVELSKGSDVGKYTGYYYTVSMTGADLYAHPLQYSDGACGLSHAVSLCRLLRVRQLCHDAVRAAR